MKLYACTLRPTHNLHILTQLQFKIYEFFSPGPAAV